MMQGRTALISMLALLWMPLPVAAHGPPNYRDLPVFFEMHPNSYGEPENLELLAQDCVSLVPLGVEDVRDFDWRTHPRSDVSWWNRIENFFYLCPLLASGEDADRRVANAWFEGWYPLHQRGMKPNVGAWDGMSVGQRAMVMTWMLKLEATRPIEDPAFSDCLVQTITAHQRFLIQEKNFEKNSNHGMWQSLGLLETTRVADNDSAAAIALSRLAYLADKSVSRLGVHREHSPGYHFTFVKWLSEYVPYLESMSPDREEVVALRHIFDRMNAVSYYLYDHRGLVPPIGDSSREQMPTLAPQHTTTPVLNDPEAGFVFFKDPIGAPFTRYIVLNTQNRHFIPTLPFHYHDDALAVYYSEDGEAILDDGGRLTYSPSSERRYIQSAAAHSTIVAGRPGQLITGKTQTPMLADEVSCETDGRAYVLQVSAFEDAVVRTVAVSMDAPEVRITDAFVPAKFARQFAVLWMIGRDVEDVEETERGRWILTTRRGRRFEVLIRDGRDKPPARVEIVEGRPAPMLGWRADGFEVFVPAKTIVVYVPMKTVESLTTSLRPVD